MTESTSNYVDGNTLVTVENMTSNRCGYVLDDGTKRRFGGNGQLTVTAEELRRLVYEHGTYMVQNVLRVKNNALAHEFGIPEDMIEYNWTEEDVVNALTVDDIAVLLDALDFGPEGIKDELASKAVEIEITDGARAQAIQEATGMDILAQIRNKHAYDSVDEQNEEEKPKQRRSKEQTATRRRRVQTEE